ncbi:hypothetical protein CF326_g8558, partial [Tilletia indica]
MFNGSNQGFNSNHMGFNSMNPYQAGPMSMSTPSRNPTPSHNHNLTQQSLQLGSPFPQFGSMGPLSRMSPSDTNLQSSEASMHFDINQLEQLESLGQAPNAKKDLLKTLLAMEPNLIEQHPHYKALQSTANALSLALATQTTRAGELETVVIKQEQDAKTQAQDIKNSFSEEEQKSMLFHKKDAKDKFKTASQSIPLGKCMFTAPGVLLSTAAMRSMVAEITDDVRTDLFTIRLGEGQTRCKRNIANANRAAFIRFLDKQTKKHPVLALCKGRWKQIAVTVRCIRYANNADKKEAAGKTNGEVRSSSSNSKNSKANKGKGKKKQIDIDDEIDSDEEDDDDSDIEDLLNSALADEQNPTLPQEKNPAPNHPSATSSPAPDMT